MRKLPLLLILSLLFAPLAVLLLLAPPVFASDLDPPSCVEEKIAVEKLKQQNAALTQQLVQTQSQLAQQMQQMLPAMQTRFDTAQQAAEAAKAEQARLEALLLKKADENPKKTSATGKSTAPEKK